MALPGGLAVAVQMRPHDAQDGDDEQDGERHIAADEGGGKDRSHHVEGRRGGVGQRGEEGGDGAGQGCEHEGSKAERLDAGARVGVGHVSPLAARQSLRRCRSLLSCGLPRLSLTAGNTCPGALPSKACVEHGGKDAKNGSRLRHGTTSAADWEAPKFALICKVPHVDAVGKQH